MPSLRPHRESGTRAAGGSTTPAAGRARTPAEYRPRPLIVTAALTGAGAALVGAVIGVAAVALSWLPASGASGNANSALRAGVLTFLAALHGGITVDGVHAWFVPAGLTLLAATITWRAGRLLATAAEQLEETEPGPLARAGLAQVAAFAAACGLLAAFSTLGTSHVAVAPAVIGALLLAALTAGVAFVRTTPLREAFALRLPRFAAPAVRIAAGVLGVWVFAGALLVAGSLVAHHGRVETLSAQVGGGWSGVPVLVLGVLAAPNAAVAAASYLAGPGFAVGAGTNPSLGGTTHGVVPAFPLLGALPNGPANTTVWVLAAVTPVAAGVVLALSAFRAPGWRRRWADYGAGVVAVAVTSAALAWLGGGAIGPGRLSTVGASPWRFGGVVAGGAAVVAAVVLAVMQAVGAARDRRSPGDEPELTLRAVLTTIKDTGKVDDEPGDEKLAG